VKIFRYNKLFSHNLTQLALLCALQVQAHVVVALLLKLRPIHVADVLPDLAHLTALQAVAAVFPAHVQVAPPAAAPTSTVVGAAGASWVAVGVADVS
jgi:hypothetical protein